MGESANVAFQTHAKVAKEGEGAEDTSSKPDIGGGFDLHFVEIPHALHRQNVDVDLLALATVEDSSTHTNPNARGCRLLRDLLGLEKIVATPLVHSLICWGYCFTE